MDDLHSTLNEDKKIAVETIRSLFLFRDNLSTTCNHFGCNSDN